MLGERHRVIRTNSTCNRLSLLLLYATAVGILGAAKVQCPLGTKYIKALGPLCWHIRHFPRIIGIG